MKRTSIELLFTLLTVSGLLLSACNRNTNPTPAPPDNGIAFPLDQDVDDNIVKSSDSDGCAPGSMKMTHQHISGASSLALEDVPDFPQDVARAHIVIPQGTYTLKIHPMLGPNCSDAGPDFATITINFGVDYRADVDHTINPVCVHRSRADFSQFDVKNSPAALDNFILDKAKSGILEALDGQAADKLNVIYFEVDRDDNEDVRCEWSELP